jgi:CubicO group peptidase (beta-lactamase class C family)
MRLRVQLAAFLAALVAASATPAQQAATPLPAAKPEQVGMSTQRLGRLSDAFKQEVDQGKLPGAVIMIARKGRLVYAEAFGMQDKGKGTPMSRDTIFRIYSMTKPLASTALMMLVEEGRVQLTDPVSKFLPAFKGQQVSVAQADSTFARVNYTLAPAAREMTIQDLLRHTSGLAYGEITQNQPVKNAYSKSGVYKSAIDYEARDLTPQEQVELLGKAPLAHQPGTVWEYSLAVDVQGRVVEAVTGKRLADFMDERIFKPLKMTDTGFWVPKEKMGRLAEALPTDPASGNPNKLIDVSAPPKNDSGGEAGVHGLGLPALRPDASFRRGTGRRAHPVAQHRAAHDLDHLGTRIATPVQPGELLLGTPGYTFGLGFAVRQGNGVAGVHGSAGEFMWAGYAGTYFWADPKEEICGVYMTQAPSPIRAYYRKMFKNLVYQSIAD